MRKEVTEGLRDRRIVTALAPLAVVFAVSLALGVHGYGVAASEYEEATAAVRAAWLDQGRRNPHDAGHHGTFAFKRPHPLTIVERGWSDYLGEWVRLETHTQNDARYRRAAESTSHFRLGAASPAAIVLLFVPLLLLLLTHALIVGEDENGTWRLLRATGIAPRTLFAGKLVAAISLSTMLMLPILGAAALAVSVAGADEAAHGALWLTVATWLGFAGGFVALGLFISALAASTRQALALCLLAWVTLCVVVPRVAASAAEAVAPTPSAFEFRRAVDAARDNKWDIGYKARRYFNEIYAEIEQDLLAEHQVASADELPIDPFGLAIEATEEEGQRAYDQTYGTLLGVFGQQERIHRTFAILSPYLAVRSVTAALAQADLDGHENFMNEAELYRREMMRTLNLDIAENARKVDTSDRSETGFEAGYVRGRDLWETVPPFEYPHRSTLDVLRGRWREMALLGLWLTATTIGAAIAVQRRLIGR